MRHLALIASLVLAGLAPAVRAQDGADPAGGRIITSHGIEVFDDLKLPADFPHLAYVNPDAPKGGELSEAIPNSTGFDNYNPFTFRGRAAVLSSIMSS